VKFASDMISGAKGAWIVLWWACMQERVYVDHQIFFWISPRVYSPAPLGEDSDLIPRPLRWGSSLNPAQQSLHGIFQITYTGNRSFYFFFLLLRLSRAREFLFAVKNEPKKLRRSANFKVIAALSISVVHIATPRTPKAFKWSLYIPRACGCLFASSGGWLNSHPLYFHHGLIVDFRHAFMLCTSLHPLHWMYEQWYFVSGGPVCSTDGDDDERYSAAYGVRNTGAFL